MADWARLRGCEVVAFNRNLGSEDARVEALRDFDVIMALRERMAVPRSVIERLPRLKLIVTAGMRNASIDIAAATARGIVVCGTGGLPYPTAELTFGLMLGLARDIPNQERALREGRWQTAAGFGLNGKTLGVLGLGTLGSRVARIARAFDMNVIAWSRNLTQEKAAEAGARRVEFDELMRTADFVTIHLVLGDRTRGLVGAREIAWMKPTAYLINTSRSPIVDEAALIEALEAGRIAGRRARRLYPGAAAVRRAHPARAAHAADAASRLLDRRGVSRVLRRGAGGHRGVARRRAGPRAVGLTRQASVRSQRSMGCATVSNPGSSISRWASPGTIVAATPWCSAVARTSSGRQIRSLRRPAR